MRNPFDERFQKVQRLHRSGAMIGQDRPVSRFTYTRQPVRRLQAKHGVGTVRFLNKTPTYADGTSSEKEFGGVTNVEIQRSIGQDAATCTITVLNNTPLGNSKPEGIDTEGRRGYLTPGRGDPIKPYKSIFNGQNTDFGMTDEDAQLTFPVGWGYPTNRYRDVFVPNTVIRTYQGYGSDNFDAVGNEIYMFDTDSDDYVAPRDDQQLYLTGTWLIDQVTFDSVNNTLTIECRDLAKLLIEQYVYPPLLPIERFPLIYCPAHKNEGQHEKVGRNVASYHSASTDKNYGKNGSVYGHRARYAFDAHDYTFWLSGPNQNGSDLEWIQANVHGEINEIVLDTYEGNYLVYVCVFADGEWQGSHHITGASETANADNLTPVERGNNSGGGFRYVITSGDTLWDLAGHYYGDNEKWHIIARANSNIIKDPHWIYPGQKIKIPYVKGTKNPPPDSTDSSGNTVSGNHQGYVSIPYVISATVPGSGKATITLPKTFKAKFVRLVFTNLNHMPFGQGSPYRVGVRKMIVRRHTPDTFVPSTEGKPGNINDWTEPVKELLAWAGFTWENPSTPDPVLGRDPQTGKALAVWGDFEELGAGPIVCTPGDYFMSKSFMDAIGLIRDFIGCIFYVDETGGAQFRLPNIWSSGNFINDVDAPASIGARTNGYPIELHEDVNLLSWSMIISDADVRSEVLVVGGYPKSTSSPAPVAGGYVLGYDSATSRTSAIDFTDILAGQYRLMIVPGETTNLFYTERECQRMAELTALFILFAYRQGTATIVGHPGLQLDDQVRIFERSTYETNAYYVSGIESRHDLESGEYTMDLTVHWLGGDPNTEWFVNKQTLTPAVLNLPAVLKRVGKQAAGGTFEQPPYGV